MISLRSIQDRRTQIAKERQALDDEERELVIAERVFMRLTNHAHDPPPRAPRGQAAAVIAVMSEGKLWWSHDDIATTASLIHGVNIKLTSLQPLMSKLKKAETVTKGAKGYALTDRLKNEASPTEIREAAI